MKILLLLAGFIGIITAMVHRHNQLNTYIPVSRQVNYSDDKMKKTTLLHFGRPTKDIDAFKTSETKFLVKLKGNSLYCGKTIIRVDNLEEGTTKYDDSGYKFFLTDKQMERAFENAKRVEPTY